MSDNRRVVLIKSLATNNRFYALASPESGMRNADIIANIPDDLHLGIAYPCLEDGLNDFAVIRTTYETLEFFPDDDEMRTELMEIIQEARTKLIRRLIELRDRLAAKKAHFLGTDLEDFKSYSLDIVVRGYPRRNLDSMMKLNIFSSVIEAEGHNDGSEPLYFYEFRGGQDIEFRKNQPAREFVTSLFTDVLDSVLDDTNYQNRYTFDKYVFQKFIALMFVNYATTDPIFYGTNKADYGVSDDKDMDKTPLYVAVAREIEEIERLLAEEDGTYVAPAAATTSSIHDVAPVELPGMLVNEDALLSPISALCAAAHQLEKKDDRETNEFARLILANASKLVQELKRLQIISAFAYDPGVDSAATDETGTGNAS